MKEQKGSLEQEANTLYPLEPKPLCPLCDRPIEKTEKSLSFQGIIFHEECYRQKQKETSRNRKRFCALGLGSIAVYFICGIFFGKFYEYIFSTTWLPVIFVVVGLGTLVVFHVVTEAFRIAQATPSTPYTSFGKLMSLGGTIILWVIIGVLALLIGTSL